jgi:hypothetical protein
MKHFPGSIRQANCQVHHDHESYGHDHDWMPDIYSAHKTGPSARNTGPKFTVF